MITSSPASARATSLDSLAFAAAMLIVTVIPCSWAIMRG
jgi:hypothetical protein